MTHRKYITQSRGAVSRDDREQKKGHSASVFWFTGLSGSGKSTIAHAVEKKLFDVGIDAYVFDGDNVRHGLCKNLGFSPEDRTENIRRISEVTKLFIESGTICLCAFIAPLETDREIIRNTLGQDYHEIYVACPLAVCEGRDVKGYYKRARAGEITNYTGISAPYQVPKAPAITVNSAEMTLEECTNNILEYILKVVTLTPST